MRTTRVLLALGSAVAGVLLAASAVDAQCTVSATSVSFGAYDVFATTSVDSTGTVTFRCAPPARDVTITLDRGRGSSFADRHMGGGSEVLRYNLYLDAARTSIWGDGTGGSQVFFRKNAPPNTDFTVTIYGRIPPGQDVGTGTYADSITVTLTF